MGSRHPCRQNDPEILRPLDAEAHDLDGFCRSRGALDGSEREPSRAFRVSVDVPTSADGAWLPRLIVDHGDRPSLDRIHCVRSGRPGPHRHDVYVWGSDIGECETTPDDD